MFISGEMKLIDIYEKFWFISTLLKRGTIMKRRLMKTVACLLAAALACISSVAVLSAEENAGLSAGQMVYVPAYSHIYVGSNEQPFLLTVTLSIRNIDPGHSITITTVDYYETQGKFLKQYLTAPVTLNPLGSLRYVVPEKDKSGGSGANFIVKWQSDKPANAPIIETIMIGAQIQQGISFTSRGRPIITSDK